MTHQRTPFFSRYEGSGGRIVPFAGFELAVQFASGLKMEHQAVRQRVGLFDVSHMGEVRVTGPGAAEALHWLLSNAVRRMKVGSAQYNMMCNALGGVVDDVFVYRLGADDFLICVNAANRDKDFAWMVENNPCPDRAQFEDQGDQWAQLAIQGPLGVEVTASLAGPDARSMKRRSVVAGTFAGIEGCILARTGYTGEDGFEVFLPADRALPAWDAVLAAGAPHGLAVCGLGARDTLRLEAGNCLYGHELGDDISPLQAGMSWAVRLRKPGGFLGRDALVARRDADRTVLVGLGMTGKRIARDGMDVLVDEVVVGHVSSGTRAPTLGRGIAMAFVDVDHSQLGTPVVVDVRGRPATAEVIEMPFYRPSKLES
jgi:aminomethyltransferase